ncbi:VOC family protein [Puia sp.]|jgi:4-hydroxyphenylpyruvate dioxygenase|uniref:VOC family protein n=1 Tax=Puia sp. TaxID=2045100 RepID=UPI002F42549F
MNNDLFKEYLLDYVEIYTPMAKALAYWHTQALGFTLVATSGGEMEKQNISSYVLVSGWIRLVLTSTYPTLRPAANPEIASFLARNYSGIKRIALRADSVGDLFEKSVANGAIPTKLPLVTEDESGSFEEASIKLFDDCEISFTDRSSYQGIFKPGYKVARGHGLQKSLLFSVDHIATHTRINEIAYWTKYLSNTIGIDLVQSIPKSDENRTGMILNISQSFDRKLTVVMAEPETYKRKSNVQQDLEIFGPGIHHLAFATSDLPETIRILNERNVEFMDVPDSYYELLRKNEDFEDVDLDTLQRWGIIIDKEEDSYLLQKFMKPISDRSYFFYELVQRVNGYDGFALKNITMLRKAAEMEMAKSERV